MRFLIFLLLSIHLHNNAYGQEVFYFSCEEFINLPEVSLDAFEKKAAELNSEEGPNNTHLTNMGFIASVVWECSENAHEFNTIMEHALDIYFRHPSMKIYILQFLDDLSSQYDEIEASNEENTIPGRWASHTFWSIGIPAALYGLYEMSKWAVEKTIGKRFQFIRLTGKQILAALGIGSAAAAVPAVASEYSEDDLTIKVNPTVLSETLFALEAYNLRYSACELHQDLKTTGIQNETEFNEYTSIHENLKSAYEILQQQRPGLFIQDFNPSNQRTSPFSIPSQLREDETYEGTHQTVQSHWIPANPHRLNHEICQEDGSHLIKTSSQLRESADILNNSPFSSESIQFQQYLDSF